LSANLRNSQPPDPLRRGRNDFRNANDLLAHSSYLDHHKLTFDELPKTDYYGIIMWNEFMKRPSKRLIKTVRQYLEKPDTSIVLIYINSQNQVVWPSMDTESKEKVKKLYGNK
jgi:hypothetical protein